MITYLDDITAQAFVLRFWIDGRPRVEYFEASSWVRRSVSKSSRQNGRYRNGGNAAPFGMTGMEAELGSIDDIEPPLGTFPSSQPCGDVLTTFQARVLHPKLHPITPTVRIPVPFRASLLCDAQCPLKIQVVLTILPLVNLNSEVSFLTPHPI